MTYVPQNRANLVAAATAAAAARGPVPRRRRLRAATVGRVTRRSLALATAALAIPVGVGATVVVLSQDHPPAQPRLPQLDAGPDGRAIDRTPLPRPPATLLAAYGRLRAPRSAEEDDHGQAIARYAKATRTLGLDADAARIVATVDGKRLWLVPGNGFVCLAMQDVADDEEVSGGCNTEAVALRDGVSASDGRTIYGLLPDGIDRIEVTDDDGFRHVEPVVHNAYLLRNADATIRYPIGRDRIETFRVIGTQPSPSG